MMKKEVSILEQAVVVKSSNPANFLKNIISNIKGGIWEQGGLFWLLILLLGILGMTC